MQHKAARGLCMIMILVFCVTGLELPSQAADLMTKVWRFEGSGTHTVALHDNGEVWSWGDNYGERLGLPGMDEVQLPKQVLIKDVKGISSIAGTTLALKTDGTVWGWGLNTNYQLGTKNSTSESSGINKPTLINGLKGITKIASGLDHSLALKGDGTVWAWGRNNEGQLGIGNHSKDSYADNRSAVPIQIKTLKNIISIEAGELYSAALDKSGDVWVWGNINNNGNTIVIPASDVPKRVSGLSSVKQISAGSYHLLALKKDGTVWGIGSSKTGQLGDRAERYTGSKIPVKAANLTDVIMISAGVEHSIALKQDGTVWGFGSNEQGQLGVNWRSLYVFKPQQAEGLEDIRSIDAVDSRTYAIRQDGSVWAVGENYSGLLANGLHSNTNEPVQVKLPGLVAVKPYEMKQVKPAGIQINGAILDFSGKNAFVNEKNILMVPASILEQQLGTSLIWMPKTNTALLQYKNEMFRFSVGDTRLKTRGYDVSLDGKPALIDKQLYIPFEFFENIAQAVANQMNKDGRYIAVLQTTKTLFDSTVQAGVDPWGKMIRTTNLPKNALDYPYILQDIPNAMYEQAVRSSQKSKIRTPVEMYTNYDFMDKTNIDAWLKRVVECYQLLLNVDYTKNNQGWATKLFNVRSQGTSKQGAIKNNQAYIDWVKKNEIQIEGSIVPQASMIFSSSNGTKVRSKVRFKLKHYKEYKDVIYDSYFKTGQKLKKGVWYEAYVDIPINSNVYGGPGTAMYVDIYASLFKDEGTFTKFTEVK